MTGYQQSNRCYLKSASFNWKIFVYSLKLLLYKMNELKLQIHFMELIFANYTIYCLTLNIHQKYCSAQINYSSFLFSTLQNYLYTTFWTHFLFYHLCYLYSRITYSTGLCIGLRQRGQRVWSWYQVSKSAVGIVNIASQTVKWRTEAMVDFTCTVHLFFSTIGKFLGRLTLQVVYILILKRQWWLLKDAKLPL
jgi:hypothetical protein